MSDLASIGEWTRKVHNLAVKKGWWDDYPVLGDGTKVLTADQILAKLALIGSEIIGECVELARMPDFDPRAVWSVGVGGKPEGFGTELADAAIRILDLCGAVGVDIEARMTEKHEYNERRPERHGGKRA